MHRYYATRDAASATRRFITPAAFHDPTRTEDGYWEIAWRDAAPGNLAWHAPLVRVEAADRRVLADDQFGAIEVSYRGHHDGEHDYRARWYDPAFSATQKCRFVLCANRDQPEIISDSFD